MKTIIGYTDSITECECCGKTELKGTFCLDIDGVELYYGSTCAFKSHGVTTDEQKKAKAVFSKKVKNEKLIEKYITPLQVQMKEALESGKYLAENVIWEYNRVIELTRKKYKIA